MSKTTLLQLDPRTYDRALSCVHCGLCLPACPTYNVTGHEADSPRGRIQLMRALADGVIAPTESVREHLDLCLDCRACETACPSNVIYHELIEETRAKLAKSQHMSGEQRLLQWLFFHVFVYPQRLKAVLLPARVLQKLGIYTLLRKSGLFKLLPPRLRKMQQMLPDEGALWPRQLPQRLGDASKHSGKSTQLTIGFFPGCIGSVMFEEVNRKAVELLVAAGATVVVPRTQNCCGAIHHHNGAHHPAEVFARQNIEAFFPAGAPGVDFVTTGIAGCGAMLREYDFLLRDDPNYVERARHFSSRVRDVSEVLRDLNIARLCTHRVEETVTYHDACHLAHAQRITAQPRELLAGIPGLTLVALPESDLCCGAAGTYNLTQPAMSTELAARKLRMIGLTQAPVCATGNVGCAIQIQSQADAEGKSLRVVHPVELLHRSVFGG